MKNRKLLSMLLTLVVALLPASAFASATINIISDDAPGTGFFDPTPAAPVGGNPGTTLGDQRIVAYLAAGDKWGTVDARRLESRQSVLCSRHPAPREQSDSNN